VIAANKGGPLGWLTARYVDWRLRRDFRGVWVRGELPKSDEGLIFYGNHPGWWDGFVMHHLCVSTGRDGYCLMEEKNLARYRFLTRLGAFSIRRGDPRSALESLGAARRILKRPRSVVIVFPQGVLTPHAAPPLRLERGVELLARKAKATCVPVGLRYAFFEDERPDLLVELGPAHGPGALAQFSAALDAVVASVTIAQTLEGFRRGM
jgi:1-acyl-sn-glycerol-3-phosphate acyltransferase